MHPLPQGPQTAYAAAGEKSVSKNVPMMDLFTVPDPEHLVATVGLNPLPVALAILTLRPRSVQLVCTQASLEEAGRIATVIGAIADESDWAATVFAPPIIVSADDLADAAATLEPYFASLTTPFRLDYSGGTKVMTVAAVTAHMQCHAGDTERGGCWRTVVDDTSGTVIDGSNAARRQDTVSTGLTIARIAELHGYTLTGTPLTTDGVAGLEKPIVDIFTGLGEVDNRSNGDLAHSLNPAELLAPFAVEVGKSARRIGIKPDETRLSKVSDLRGQWRELLTAHLLLHLLAEDREARDAVSEVLFDANLRPNEFPAADRKDAQFDLIVRSGHRVLALEVKSNARDAVEFLSERLIPSRWPFGSAVTSVVASAAGVFAGKGKEVTWAEANDTKEALTRDLPALRDKVAVWLIERPHAGQDEVTSGFRSWLVPHTDANTPQMSAPPAPRLSRATIALAADGTPLAVKATLQWAGNHHIVAIGPPDETTSAAFFRSSQTAKIARSNCEYVSAAHGEHATYLALGPYMTHTDAVVVTPGPKVVAAGLIRRALEHNKAIVHIGIDGSVTSVTTRGQDRTTVTTVLDFKPDWLSEFNDGRGAVHETTELPDAGTAAVVQHLKQMVPEGDSLTILHRRPSAATRDDAWIVAGTRGCASLHYWSGTSSNRKAYQQKLRSQASLLNARVGDAYKPLLILKHDNSREHGNSREHFGRYEVRDRWLPVLDYHPDTGTLTGPDGALDAIVHHLIGRTMTR